MTTTATFPTLHPPLPEDTMDIASPGRMDHDIEIDFDEQLGGVDAALTDDERMMEDGEQTRPGTATDLDMMEAEVQHDVQEEEMHDDFDAGQYEAADPDDELIDYDDDDFAEPTLVGEQDMLASEEAGALAAPEPFAALAEAPNDGGFGQDLTDAASAPDQVAAISDEHVAATDFQSALSMVENVAPALSTIHEDVAEGDTLVEAERDNPESNALHTHAEGTFEAFDHSGDLEHGEATSDVTHVEIDAPSAADYENEDLPGTPTDTGLHPMTIRFADYDWPLFKSKRQPEGLLKDDNLVNLSLADLLTNCKQRIAIKLGEDISEEQEFVLAFDSLGLVVTQGSNACGSITLNEVLEVYTHLCDNDVEMDDVPPLTLTLSLQLRFERHLSLLRDAAARGEGIPKLVNPIAEENGEEQYEDDHENRAALEQDAGNPHLDHTGAEDHGQYQEEYQEDQEIAPHGAIYDDEDDQAAGTHDGTTAGETDQAHLTTGDYQNDDAAGATHQDGQAYDEEQDEEPYVEDGEGEYEQHRPAVNHDERVQGAVQTDDAAGPADDAHAVEANDAHAEEDNADEAAVESGASSTTLRADQAEDTNGKYSYEDLIDWDDELSLTPPTSEPGREGGFDELDYLDDPEYAIETHQEDAQADETRDLEQNADHGYDYDDTHADTLQEIAGDEVDQDDVDAHGSTVNGGVQVYDEADELTHGDAPEATDGDDTYEALDDEQAGLHPDQLDGDAAAFEDPNEDAADDDTAPHALEDSIAQPAIPHSSSPAGLEDDIDFDDDTEAQHAAKTAASGSGAASPLGKRSFDEYENLYDDEGEPTPKKARAS
ncbi:hypothetical protein B0A48_17725 [Cryoendolithus antarcticus]|uniref:Uncharacterized protein n=1 Tax=Cryoendolithus antarcticus TaxID=1507870 RepID=A0A1V8SAH6_9PEZI|nr:hypothetical protein B0A48_17725 [Cryoendolithus antarcticus]